MKRFLNRLKGFSLIAGLLLIAVADVSAQFTYSESFDGIFPPTGWSTTGINSLWVQRTNGTNPQCTPHSGTAMARFSSFNQNPGTQDVFVSPVVDFSGNTGNNPTFSLWVYRDGNSTAGDSVSIFVNTNTTLNGATRIGGVARSRFFVLPVNELTDGWYQYTFNAPSTLIADTNYFILQGTSHDGGNIYIDDVSWVAYPTLCSGTPTAGTLTSDQTLICGGTGSANLTLSGSTVNMSGVVYQWQSSPTDLGPWTDFGASALTENSGTITSSTYFRCYVNCTASGLSDSSNVVLVTISSNPIPVVTVNPNTNVIYCTNSAPLVLVANGAGTYTWTPDIAIPNGVGDSALSAPTFNTTYTVTGIDSSGCTGSTTVLVTVRNSPNVTASSNNTVICSGQTTNLHAQVFGPPMGIQYEWNPGGLIGANQNITPTNTTTYVVSATSTQSGCTGLDTLIITVNPSNVAAFTFSIVNQTATFTNGSTGGTSWLWDFGDGNTSTDENPVYTYTSNGVYIVTLTVTNGLCASSTITQTIIVGPAGIETLNDLSDMILFPNPTRGPVTIIFRSESHTAEIDLIDQLGRNIKQTTATQGVDSIFRVEFETGNLANGVYQIKVLTDKETRLHTFVKK